MPLTVCQALPVLQGKGSRDGGKAQQEKAGEGMLGRECSGQGKPPQQRPSWRSLCVPEAPSPVRSTALHPLTFWSAARSISSAVQKEASAFLYISHTCREKGRKVR